MRAIIVDDEVVLVNELKKLLNEVGGFDIVGTFLDGMSALQSIEETQPEVAFLDIEMVGFNGIVLAEKLLGKLPHIEILFVTAFNHYATEAFEANAVDYILKPIRLERLKKAVNKLHSNKIASRNDQDLSIQCFGKFSVYIGEEPLRWSRAKQQELFAYLLQYEGRWVDKYKICDDLWKNSNSEQALANLQTAIWAIRKVLKNSGVSSVKIEYARDSYIMYISNCSVAPYSKMKSDCPFNACFTATNVLIPCLCAVPI